MRQSFFLDAALMDGLKRLKERDGMPQAEAVRRAVAEFLKAKGISLEPDARVDHPEER